MPCVTISLMKKDILLISPPIHDFAAYDLWMKPLGLLYVAAAAEAAGYSVRVINCLDRLHPDALALDSRHSARSVGQGRGKFSFQEISKPGPLTGIPRIFKRYGIPLRTLENELRRGPRPDAVGIGSMMTYWYPGVTETIEKVRQVHGNVPIILGGIYATLCPDHARTHSGADYVVKGEGERQFVELLGNIVGQGEETRTPSPLLPAYHLLGKLDSVSMLTSRGCPFCCAYCASRFLSTGFVQRPVSEVVQEILHYAEFPGVRDIAFYDDALLVNPERHVKPILREVVARKPGLRLHSPNGLHVNLIDWELADLMRQAGFATVRLSLESIHPTRLEDSCRKVSVEGFRRGLSHLVSAGFQRRSLEAYVLMGAPGQEEEEIEETMHLVHQEGALIRLADFSPIPGTGYFQEARRCFGRDFEEPLFQNSSVLPFLVPDMAERYRRLKSLARSLNKGLGADAT